MSRQRCPMCHREVRTRKTVGALVKHLSQTATATRGARQCPNTDPGWSPQGTTDPGNKYPATP